MGTSEDDFERERERPRGADGDDVRDDVREMRLEDAREEGGRGGFLKDDGELGWEGKERGKGKRKKGKGTLKKGKSA